MCEGGGVEVYLLLCDSRDIGVLCSHHNLRMFLHKPPIFYEKDSKNMTYSVLLFPIMGGGGRGSKIHY